MRERKWTVLALAGLCAGCLNGLFGGGGGMLLVPILSRTKTVGKERLFPASVAIILPICVISLLFRVKTIIPALQAGLPYLLGSIPGGLLALKLNGKIPVKWLHRGLGILILWGGIRYLW